jgi:hypothetical protein
MPRERGQTTKSRVVSLPNNSLQRPVGDKVHVARTRHARGALTCARIAHRAAAELGRYTPRVVGTPLSRRHFKRSL